MKKMFWLFSVCVAVFTVFMLSGHVFAQAEDTGEVTLSTLISRIPAARILDWEGGTPTVDKQDGSEPQLGWEEQALNEGYEVCCPAGEGNYVEVALDQSGENTAIIQEGSCLTIGGISDGYVEDVKQDDEGEDLYELSGEPSGFSVETPTATIGVSGTAFNVIVEPGLSTRVEVIEGALDIVDKAPDPGDQAEYAALPAGQQITIIKDGTNIVPDLIHSTIKEILDAIKDKHQEIKQIRKEISQIKKLLRSEDRESDEEELQTEMEELRNQRRELKQEIAYLLVQLAGLR